MRKLIFSVMAMMSLAFASEAVTYMCVKTSDGQVVKYDVENVVKVDFEGEPTLDGQGVTVSGKVGDYPYVDLGLPSGIKWATYNVGANNPIEYGDYFAWAETEAKTDYSWSKYKWCTVKWSGEFVSVTKYVITSDYGTVDGKNVVEAVDDAATANWGSAWRMPTRSEQNELRVNCDWEWVADYNGTGIAGMVGTSKANGNVIFLPAAGYYYEPDLYDAGKVGFYWSSSIHEKRSNRAYYLEVRDDNTIYWSTLTRYFGHSVRAVSESE